MQNLDLLNPTDGVITSSFGTRLNPISSESEEHNGIDITNEEGTSIVAVDDGIITEIYQSQTYGNVVKYKLTNYDNVTIMYAHNEKIFVNLLDEVKRGDKISSMGSSGYVTGTHLHYIIYVDDDEIDPINYVNLPYTEDVVLEYVFRGDIN